MEVQPKAGRDALPTGLSDLGGVRPRLVGIIGLGWRTPVPPNWQDRVGRASVPVSIRGLPGNLRNPGLEKILDSDLHRHDGASSIIEGPM